MKMLLSGEGVRRSLDTNVARDIILSYNPDQTELKIKQMKKEGT